MQKNGKNFPKLGDSLLEKKERVVDLTREIFEGMPQWFGHQKTFVMRNQTHEEFMSKWKTDMGFQAHNLLISEHAGTHTDAIFEYNSDGPTLDESPLEFYYGPAVCIDLAPYIESDDEIISADKLKTAVEDASVTIKEGDIVLLHCGYGDRVWPEEKYAEDNPGLSDGAARFLAEQGVINIGIDHVSIDSSADPNFSAHKVCAEFGIVNTESLTNLDQLVNERVTFYGLPLNIRGGTGSPIRAFAIRNQSE